MSLENPSQERFNPYKDYADKQPDREKALQESIFPKADEIAQKDIWNVDLEELEALREELREHNMGPSRLASGEFANAIDTLNNTLQDRTAMLNGDAHKAFAVFKAGVENLRSVATGAF